MENVAADHLSWLENSEMEGLEENKIGDNFPKEYLMVIVGEEPWYGDIANYLASGYLTKGLTHQQKKKIIFWSQILFFG